MESLWSLTVNSVVQRFKYASVSPVFWYLGTDIFQIISYYISYYQWYDYVLPDVIIILHHTTMTVLNSGDRWFHQGLGRITYTYVHCSTCNVISYIYTLIIVFVCRLILFFEHCHTSVYNHHASRSFIWFYAYRRKHNIHAL